jgi:hypothetical protein
MVLGVFIVGFWGHRGLREHRGTSPQAFEKRLTGQSRICPRYESFGGAQDKVSAVSFSALPLGWVLPAGSEVIITTDFTDLRGFAYYIFAFVCRILGVKL